MLFPESKQTVFSAFRLLKANKIIIYDSVLLRPCGYICYEFYWKPKLTVKHTSIMYETSTT